MQAFFDFLPIVIFFVVYKFLGIYFATASAIVISVAQVAVCWFKQRTVSTFQLISLTLILLLGGSTLFFHNELFIKWKPTVLYWVMALAFVGTHYFSKKPLIQSLIGTHINLPDETWSHVNLSWSLFFMAMGILNLFVAYHFDTDTWVNFKLFGILGLTLLFIVLQSVYLSRYIKVEEE